MSGFIATYTDQIVLCVRMEIGILIRSDTRRSRIWQGCLEVERKEYTAKDILHLADDKPEDIVKVWRIDVGSGSCEDITDLVLEAGNDTK